MVGGKFKERLDSRVIPPSSDGEDDDDDEDGDEDDSDASDEDDDDDDDEEGGEDVTSDDDDDDDDDEEGEYDRRVQRERRRLANVVARKHPPRPRPHKFTVFAPTDQAVKEFLEGMNKNGWDDLTDHRFVDIVKFHIIENDIRFEDDLHCTRAIEMMNGKDSRTVCTSAGKHQKGAKNPRNDMPRIINDDIVGCNGVLHFVNE